MRADDGMRDWSVAGVQACALAVCCTTIGVSLAPVRFTASVLVPVRLPSEAVTVKLVVALLDSALIAAALEIGRASCREGVTDRVAYGFVKHDMPAHSVPPRMHEPR